MKAIVCEMCQSHDVVKQDRIYVCQECGTKYSVEDAKNLMQDVDDVPAVHADTKKSADSDERDNLYMLARRAKDAGNSADAAKYYGMLQTKDPTGWEPLFFSTYYTAMQTNIANIASAANLVEGCINSTLELIRDNLRTDAEQEAALKAVFTHASLIATMLHSSAKNHHAGISEDIKHKYIDEYITRARTSANILKTLGESVEQIFKDKPDFMKYAVAAWDGYIDLVGQGFDYNSIVTSFEFAQRYYGIKILKYDRETGSKHLNKRLKALDNKIAERSSTISPSKGVFGCSCFVITFFTAIMTFCFQNDPGMREGLLFVTIAFGVLGVIGFLPKPKSAKQREEDNKFIDEYIKEQDRIRKALGEE